MLGGTVGSPKERMENIKSEAEIVKVALHCRIEFSIASEERSEELQQAEHELKLLEEDIVKSEARHEELLAALKASDEEKVTIRKKKDEDIQMKDEEMTEALRKKDEEMQRKEEEMQAAMMKMKEELETANRANEREMEALKKTHQAALRKRDEDLEMANQMKERDVAALRVKDELMEEVAAALQESDMDRLAAAALRGALASLERTKTELDKIKEEGRKKDVELQLAEERLYETEMMQDGYMATAHVDDLAELLRLQKSSSSSSSSSIG